MMAAMNKIKVGFFSFTEITDPKEHHAYNEWHQLDHMPEQFPLPGIARGDRWVSTPACRRARAVSAPLLDPIHYVTLYLMTEPLDDTLRDFVDLGGTLRELGRFHLHRRGLMGGAFYRVKEYASPRVLVSAESIPARPQRGVYITVQDVSPDGEEEYAQWFDRVHAPAILELPEVAGLWTFASRGGPPGKFANPNPSGRRIHVTYLDGDPLTYTASLPGHLARWRDAGLLPDHSKSVETLFAGPLETITPWQWSWFDEEAGA